MGYVEPLFIVGNLSMGCGILLVIAENLSMGCEILLVIAENLSTGCGNLLNIVGSLSTGCGSSYTSSSSIEIPLFCHLIPSGTPLRLSINNWH